jgi:hypothetical protein
VTYGRQPKDAYLRLLAQVDYVGECFVFTGKYRTYNGYVRIWDGSTQAMQRINRLVWEKFHGPLAPNLVVRHLCHNRLCVRPSHLLAGTHSENMRDMVAAGRACSGIANHLSKLDPEKVLRIRELHLNGVGVTKISEMFSVSRFCIYQVLNRHTWKHVQ